MDKNIRFVLILAAVLVFLRFGFRLLVRLVQGVYMLAPLLVRGWYISIPVAVLIYFLILSEVKRRRRLREFSNLDPDKEIKTDGRFEDEKKDEADEERR